MYLLALDTSRLYKTELVLFVNYILHGKDATLLYPTITLNEMTTFSFTTDQHFVITNISEHGTIQMSTMPLSLEILYAFRDVYCMLT